MKIKWLHWTLTFFHIFKTSVDFNIGGRKSSDYIGLLYSLIYFKHLWILRLKDENKVTACASIRLPRWSQLPTKHQSNTHIILNEVLECFEEELFLWIFQNVPLIFWKLYLSLWKVLYLLPILKCRTLAVCS